MLEKGQSLFEVVVAIGIITLVLVTLISLTTLSIRNVGLTVDRSQASRTALETIEWLRSQRDTDWSTFHDHALIPVWCMQVLDWSDPSKCSSKEKVEGQNYLREIQFSVMSADSVEAKAVVYWNDSHGYHESRSTTIFTNWQ